MEQAPKPTEAPKPKSKTVWVAIAVIIIIVVAAVAVYYFTLPPAANISIFENPSGSCSSGASPPNCGYTPATFNTGVNSPVRWRNDGSLLHTVTANATANGSLPTFDSGNLDSGAFFERSFTTSGTYKYFCTIHPWMKAEVIVA